MAIADSPRDGKERFLAGRWRASDSEKRCGPQPARLPPLARAAQRPRSLRSPRHTRDLAEHPAPARDLACQPWRTCGRGAHSGARTSDEMGSRWAEEGREGGEALPTRLVWAGQAGPVLASGVAHAFVGLLHHATMIPAVFSWRPSPRLVMAGELTAWCALGDSGGPPAGRRVRLRERGASSHLLLLAAAAPRPSTSAGPFSGGAMTVSWP